MKQKRLFVVVISALVIMISVTYQGTYSYFTSRVEGTGNTENNQSQVNTITLKNLIISEGANVTSSNMIPGDSVEYTFIVENPNNIDVCYNLLWTDVINTFVNKNDLYYRLYLNDMDVPSSYGVFPSETDGTVSLLDGMHISANTTYTFTLVVTYDETDEDQSADIGKTFSGKIIGELGECSSMTLVDWIKSDSVVTSGEGLYEISHADASITYTDDATIINNLQQTELRYVGYHPYVYFNEELWQVIGLVNTPEGQRVKIMRDEPIGAYSWDTSSEEVNGGYGINQWGESTYQDGSVYNGADLMKLLNPGYEANIDILTSYDEETSASTSDEGLVNNSLYWNRGSGACYNSNNNDYENCDFTDIGLTEKAKSMIDKVTWNTGAVTSDDISSITTLEDIQRIYELERSNNTDTGSACTDEDYCTDTVNRTTSWTGYVGLPSLSDYYYRYGWDTATTYINMAVGASITSVEELRYSPIIRSMVGDKGKGLSYPAASPGPIYPTVYLKTDVKASGAGGIGILY